MDSREIQRIVREVVESVLGGAAGCAEKERGKNPGGRAEGGDRGVFLIKGVEMSLKQFDLVPGVNARLVDFVNSSHGCSMAIGLMELRECTFDWTLNYEEVDYVLDGTLDIIVGDRTYRAFSGDAIFIPKGTSIKFSTPDRALFLYTTYPADWANQ
ncbi:MAG: ethanolamine utilization protein EutQ [Firmicutes bacterium]|nr:ethanolamine utilization protein EutQ [Bacillota bacterium]